MGVHLPAETRRPVLACGLLLTACCLVLTLFPPRVLRDTENLVYDALVRQLRPEPHPPDVVVVDVDARSLAALGQWPWPRYRIAALLEQCAAAGARSVGVDLLFAEPDRLSLGRVRETYARERGVEVRVAAPADTQLDNDELLADALRRGRVVLGAHMEFGAGPASERRPGKLPSVALRGEPGTSGAPPLAEARGATWPLASLADAAAMVGAVNSLPDGDGKFRRMPLFVRRAGEAIPSLALATVLVALDERQAVVRWSEAGVTGVEAAGIAIPTDLHGNLLLSFRGRPTERFDHVPAVDLLEGRVAPERIRDKIVFVGSSASGLRDEHPVPVMRMCPGVDLHALAADAMLRGDFVAEPAWIRGAQLLIVLAGGLLVTFVLVRASLTLAAAVVLGATVALVGGSWLLLDRGGLSLSPVPGASTLLVGFAVLALIRFRRDERRVLENVRLLSAAQSCTILGLVSIVETRDPETGRHITRTQHFTRVLAGSLRRRPEFHAELTPENVEAIFKSAPLHDIGKVGVPDQILLKTGHLSAEEFEVLKRHTSRGYEVLRRAEEQAGLARETSFLRYAKEMALHHHERWDGTGYPHGRQGDEIPLSARMLAVADVYDALRSQRPYKPAFPHARARSIICEGRGTHFDPRVVDAFLEVETEFQAITARYPDVAEPLPDALESELPYPVATPETCSEVLIHLDEQR